jgi:hypothetical protein
MSKASKRRDIAEAFADDRLITRALRKGVRDAMRRHRQAGCPVVIWRRGKVVCVPPEEIRIPGESRG